MQTDDHLAARGEHQGEWTVTERGDDAARM